MSKRPDTPFVKNVRFRSRKGKDPITPIDSFSNDILNELINIEENEINPPKKIKLSPIKAFSTTKNNFLILNHRLRDDIHIPEKKNYTLQEVLEVIRNIDDTWESSVNNSFPKNYTDFYIS